MQSHFAQDVSISHVASPTSSDTLNYPTIQPIPPPSVPLPEQIQSPASSQSEQGHGASPHTPPTISSTNLLWWMFLGIKPFDQTTCLPSSSIQQNMSRHGYKSGGLLSLWNNLFSTNPTALKALHDRAVNAASRYDRVYKRIQHGYTQPLDLHLGLSHNTNRYVYGKNSRTRSFEKTTTQKLLKQLQACQAQFAHQVQASVDAHRTVLSSHDHLVQAIRLDFLHPGFVELPPKLQQFISMLKSTNMITKHIYNNGQYNSPLELIVSILVLLAVHYPEPFRHQIIPFVQPIAFVWLHVQKDQYNPPCTNPYPSMNFQPSMNILQIYHIFIIFNHLFQLMNLFVHIHKLIVLLECMIL
eukprot:UN02644